MGELSTEPGAGPEDTREIAEEYRAIFEATGDGVIIADMEGNLVDVNPALCRMHGYTREEMLHLYPTDFIHPAYHGVFAEYMRSLQEDRAYTATALDLRKDGSSFPVEVNGTLFTFREHRHILGMVRDISERVEAEEQYRRIFEATNDAIIITDFQGFCVEANPAACRLYGYSHEEMIRTNAADVTHPDYHDLARHFMETVSAGGAIQAESINFRKDGTPFHIETRASWFLYRGKPHVLAVIRDITERVKARELLELRVEERTRELNSLLEVSHTVGTTLELDPLLDLLLNELKTVVDYGTAGILVVEEDTVQVLGFRGPVPHPHLRTPVPVSSWPEWEQLKRGDTVIVNGPGGLRERFLLPSYMVVPMGIRDRVIGGLSVSHPQPGYFNEHHASLLRSFASQAAIAIENARLYEKAQELAILEERQRLSRDLHDSVSQALYGIGLAAETIRASLPQDPDRAARANEMVRSFAASGMAEMRALLFELRPESLELEGLVAALEKQAHAVQARYGVPVTTALDEEPDVSLPVKEALYRIAQEALHNAVKHAQPATLEVRLRVAGSDVVLDVRDDGRGFDAGESFPGHLGLRTMRERVTRLGGTLEIESAPGEGTSVRARVDWKRP